MAEKEQEIEKKQRKKHGAKFYIATISLAVVSFLLGSLTMYFSLDKQMRKLISVKQAIDRNYYEEVSDEAFYDAVFDGVNGLLDPYSCYLTADEYKEMTTSGKGVKIGVGLEFLTKDEKGNEQMLIARVCGNSPAEEAGLVAGDRIVGFGSSEHEIKASVTFSEFSDFIAPYGSEEKFFVKVKNGEETRVTALRKRQYVENYVFYRTKTKAYRFAGEGATTLTEAGKPLTCLDEKTAYLRLTQFSGVAVDTFRQAMDLFKRDGKKNLVLDLRGNGGGYLDVMQEIASYFCKNSDAKKPIAAVAEYNNKKEKYAATGNRYDEYFDGDSRICVLADGNTASASECLIGVLVDYGATMYEDICLSMRGGVAKTYGKGIMQTTYPFIFGGDAIKLTTAKIVWPISGRCIHGIGILPSDGALTVEENYEGDAEIESAIEKLFA